MAKNNWNVTELKKGCEIFVSNAYKSFYIGESYPETPIESVIMSKKLAHIICDALNANNTYPNFNIKENKWAEKHLNRKVIE